MRVMVSLVVIGIVLPAEAQTGVPQAPAGYETATYPYASSTSAPRAAVPYVVVPNAPNEFASTTAAPVPRLVSVERTSTIRGLWLPGLIVLPIAWLTTMTVASSTFEGDAASYAWIPVVGPWLMLTQDLNGNDAGVIVSGIVQGLSTLALVLGLAIKRTWVEQQYVIDQNSGARLRFDAISLPGGGLAGLQIQL
jgi:hypothetical protein